MQVGFARLPQAGSEAHIEVVRQWLQSCDETHTTPSCKPPDQGYQFTDSVRPTRLLAVGDPGSDKVRLYESQANDTEHWIALSHQWGPNKAEHYSTNSDNVDSFMVGMNYNDLPGTFKDAVTVTRALGIKYLWIDSLCIIQAGPKSDFEKEAKLMEMVYSSAYCVIAASRAAGHGSGFLQERNARNVVTISQDTKEGASYSICQNIDNFREHVLQGALNKRGWVLQEHALARRTIFFTEHQTYWECGCGVRCETMTHMKK